ncbi:MAG TPA: hypothetical protein VG073_00645, partial [Gaiellaceae bacterium]|nr:hypothetical protein [Gaiellaceae bacterium]
PTSVTGDVSNATFRAYLVPEAGERPELLRPSRLLQELEELAELVAVATTARSPSLIELARPLPGSSNNA